MRSTVLFALLFVACTASPVPGAGGTVVVQFGGSSQVNSDLRVTFAKVVEDSRCPATVVCVWQGNGAVRLDVTTGRGPQSVTLNTAGGDRFPREASAAGYTFTLVALDPPQPRDAIPVDQYRATIRVAPGQ